MTSIRGVARPFLAGLFLICMCSLMLQIIETRLLSVISWYYLAFFAISMAMFGMTAGSLLIYFNAGRFKAERMLEHLSWISWGFALAIAGSGLMIISTVILSVTGTAMLAVLWLKTILVILPPYVLAGMAISLSLTRSPWPIGLVYGVDLVGAATGCLMVLALMSWVDGISALFAVGAIAAGASVCFRTAWLRSNAADRLHTGWRTVRHPGLLALLLAGLAAGNAAIQPRGLAPVLVKNGVGIERASGAALEFVLAHPRRTRGCRGAVDVGTVAFPAAVQGSADVSDHRRIGWHGDVPVRWRPRKARLSSIRRYYARLLDTESGPLGGDRCRWGT